MRAKRHNAVAEGLAGVAGGVLGLLVLAYLLFAPILKDGAVIIRGGAATTSTAYASAAQHGLPIYYVAFFAMLAIVLAGVALSASADARTHRAGWRRLLIALVGAQVLLVVLLLDAALDYLPPHLTAATLWNALSATGGVILLPSLVLALVAVLFARQQHSRGGTAAG